ncbi:adrenocortical dysplasia protein homolog isoform X2 [Mixophyes fleayi]
MEANAVNLMNCNMEPGVRQKINELWQNYMKEREMSESSDMNLSDVSLTQLLMVETEEKFRALKSVAEHCLDLNLFETQEIPRQARTKWSNKDSTSSFSIPVNLLLIPPHEESALEQMTEFRNDLQITNDIEACSDQDNSSQIYSTAISTLSEEPMDDGPSSQSGNPWNKLQPLCVSVATCSDSQPRISTPVTQQNGEEELVADPDSCTPDIFISHVDVSISDSEDQNESSSLTFSGQFSNTQLPETKILTNLQHTNELSSNSDLCTQRLSDTSIASLGLIPLSQNSLKDCSTQTHITQQKSLCMGSKVQICPVLSRSPESQNSPRIKIGQVSPNDGRNQESYLLRTRKALKRKHALEDSETTLSDLEQQIPMCVERTDSGSTVSGGDGITTVTNMISQVQTVFDKQLGERNGTPPVSNMEKEQGRTEQVIKTASTKSPKIVRKCTAKMWIQAHKPSLEFVVKPKMLATKCSQNILPTADVPATSRANLIEASSNVTCGPSSTFHAKEKHTAKLTHYDGTPFQYKYKSLPSDLCARVNAVRMPADLCEWAVKILSEHKGKVP